MVLTQPPCRYDTSLAPLRPVRRLTTDPRRSVLVLVRVLAWAPVLVLAMVLAMVQTAGGCAELAARRAPRGQAGPSRGHRRACVDTRISPNGSALRTRWYSY